MKSFIWNPTQSTEFSAYDFFPCPTSRSFLKKLTLLKYNLHAINDIHLKWTVQRTLTDPYITTKIQSIYIHPPRSFPMSLCYPFLWLTLALGNHWFTFYHFRLHFPVFHINGIIQYVIFCSWLPSCKDFRFVWWFECLHGLPQWH